MDCNVNVFMRSLLEEIKSTDKFKHVYTPNRGYCSHTVYTKLIIIDMFTCLLTCVQTFSDIQVVNHFINLPVIKALRGTDFNQGEMLNEKTM